MAARDRIAMSRAVDRLRLSGRPLALAKWVFCMPSSWARRVMSAAKRLSVPEGTIKSRAYYAVRALRTAFEEMGVLR